MVPAEDEIEDAIKKLRRNRSGGGVGDASRAPERVAHGVQNGEMAVEKVEEKTEEEEEGGELWKKLVDLVQTAFR